MLKGVRMGYLRTKTTPFCADDGQGVRLRFLVQVP